MADEAPLPSPTPDAPTPSAAAAAAEGGGEKPKLSKNQLKKLAKGKGKKPKKEKPQWGTGKKKEPKKMSVTPKVPFVNPTPKGAKKDLANLPFADTYDPEAVEAGWQDWWEAAGFYKGNPDAALGRPEQEKFVMVIPPPNVTGSLHLGHALTAAVEDTLTRWHRMKGHATLYVPGTDHAGIATQNIVEQQLWKRDGKTRHDLGRDAFIRQVWEWKHEKGTRITTQLRRLGSSVDWSRERFTMDDMLSKAVVEAFNRFYEKGRLYRANRLGNWSCALKSAISDIEVDHIELEGRTFLEVQTHKGNPADPKGRYEFGVLTHFAYPVEASEEVLVVATTRLETMLGDTAVAVHPDDSRYTHLHGKCVIHPFSGRKIPIVTDPVLVDMSFGTGAVKITPAHDPNDYQCGKRHNLEFMTVLTPDGAINHHGGEEFEGLMRYDARIAVEEALKKKGLFKGKEPNKMRLGICSRSKDILEPMITPQWYVNCNDMAKRSTDAVRNKELKIIPAEHEKTWYYWLDNIQDWCVSRQLWWGHQIPAWFAKTKAEGEKVQKMDMANNDRWIVARSEEDAKQKALKLLGCSEDELLLERDEDVLDTWFSSGLFPFSVMGWPDDTADLKAFYPTSLLETGSDILFFWVARMVMMGLELTDTLPFHTVFLHAMVRDREGRKMSKSLGNVIDPLEVIGGCSLKALQDRIREGNLPAKEIARATKNLQEEFPTGIVECGSDALRFGLLAYTVQGKDINLDVKRVVGYRNFCNKMWNSTRFALMYLQDFQPTSNMLDDLMSSGKMAIRDKFMISRLMKGMEAVDQNFTTYTFGDAQQAGHQLWLNDMCDVYLELIKPIVQSKNEEQKDVRWAAQATLWVALETQLRGLHSMMPYITEELWQRLPGRGTFGKNEPQTIMLAKYPEIIDSYKNDECEESMTLTLEIIKACRSLRASYNIQPKDLTHFFIKMTEGANTIQAQVDDIMTLASGSKVDINPPDTDIPDTVGTMVVNNAITVLVDLKGKVDFKTEIGRLNKNLKKAKGPMEQLEIKMKTTGYQEKVPDDLKSANHEKLNGLKKKCADIEGAIASFERLLTLDDK